MLNIGSCLLTPCQRHQILDLFASEEHVALEVTWSAFQNPIDAYRAPDTSAGKALMRAEVNALISTRVPRGLIEIITLGGTLKRRVGDVLAYFEHPQTTGNPTEAIKGRLEHLCGAAIECRNLPSTSPKHSSKPTDSNPNYTPIMKSPINDLAVKATNLGERLFWGERVKVKEAMRFGQRN